MCLVEEDKKNDSDSEREVWENMTPAAWHNSITSEGSIFAETYEETRKQIASAVRTGHYDVVVEVGCGTGDIVGYLGRMEGCSTIPRYGIDINQDFIDFCDHYYPHDNCEFLIQDATTVADEWWKKNGFDIKYKRPLVICVNNTLNVMPEAIRGSVVGQMLRIAGDDGRCLISYWNGQFFSHAVMNYYKKNQDLCGPFCTKEHVDWESRSLLTQTNYSTKWYRIDEVQKLLRAYDVDIDVVDEGPDWKNTDHINCKGLAIFAWFSFDCTSQAKGYYDSEDAQKFYRSVWGQENTHVGRYDKLSDAEKKDLSMCDQILKAQHLHEDDFLSLVKTKFPDTKVRLLDMGCGFGGLLRLFWKNGVVWTATGVDIAAKMCHQARILNSKIDCEQDITILEESYLHTSVTDESVDLVISMDALLHVGPEGQSRAVREAARVLRPGGWMIFTDIMQQEEVDAEEMQPIYDRIHLSKLGTVSHYRKTMTEAGFRHFEFHSNAENIPMHYGSILKVLQDENKINSIGLSKEYLERMKTGLKAWQDLGPKNIEWGFILAQKTVKVEL